MVIIFRGPSGSGKTTLKDLLASIDFKIKVGDEALEPSMTPAIAYAKVLWGSIIKSEHAMHICSADDFFMINGVYKFDAKLLGTAHATCLRNFSDLVKDPKNVIIVDNTNCSLAEFVPYAALANAYAHELHIMTLLTEPVTAWKRNKHNVPFNNIVKQSYSLMESINNMPPWFPQQVFPN